MDLNFNPKEETVEILIVEDSPTQAERLKYDLEHHHYRVRTAENGERALALLGEYQPTLVITDIVMPGMNGYELCEKIKSQQNTKEIPVILLTSLASSEDVLEGLACGADNFITKPYSEDYLISSVQQILTNRKLNRSGRVRIGIEIVFAGRRRFITADQQQMLSLLLSTYEAAVHRNAELTKTRDELRTLNERLEGLVEERTAALSQEIVERKRAEERERHLNAVLRAIRGINQLITREKNRDRLIREACAILTSTRSFDSAWIALVDREGEFVKMAESGLKQKQLKLKETLKRDEWPQCARAALLEPGVVVSENSDSACLDCPLTDHHRGKGTLAIRLEQNGKVYGVMAVSLSRDMSDDPEEQGLFGEAAGDVAFALAGIGMVEEKVSLEDQLRQSQKLEGVGRLAGGIAHDFNNLLTMVIGNTDLLLMEVAPGAPMREELEEIKAAGERAAGLTRQLLAFSRKQVLQPTVMDLNETVLDMDKMLRRIIGEDIDLQTTLAPDIGRVEADRGQIEQVIMNLAVNARDAMPKGGKLTIETANAELDEDYAGRHVAVTPGHYVMLSISDTGVGMSREIQAQVFEPFFTTKETGKGTGLGLSTVYGIVKQSNGNIWVYSEPGQGTTFKIYLPLVKKSAIAAEKKRKQTAPPTGTETLLVVEDDEMVRHLAVRILGGYGYNILSAADGRQAVDLADEHQGPIHLMLTDVVMPGMNARVLEQNLKISRPKMKVLYMSGYTDNAIVHHGVLDAGMAFIGKPFTPESLGRKVRDLLDSPGPGGSKG